MIKNSRRVGSGTARTAVVPTREDHLSAIAGFERWQRSMRDHRVLRRRMTRARRVILSAPILYRAVDHDGWEPSQVVNLSETGMLFGPTLLERGVGVEVIVSVPPGAGAFAGGKQICVGEIVRTTSGGMAAARFDECRFLLES